MEPAFNLIWVDGWDNETDEAVGGGRTLDTAETAREAVHLYAIWSPVCQRYYGDGELVVTDRNHHRVPPYRLAFLEGREMVAVA